jgi:2-C-methyl-D-erythritol 2,4-cyclodiphosphate synthase
MGYRIGSGIDVHQLVEGRPLIIGGVTIPHHKGALGHSDADVLLHAICDALLGALSLGDIGNHFPDTDPQYKDINSRILLQQTFLMIQERKYKVVNIDTSLSLEAPKIKKYTGAMKTVIADILQVTEQDVSIKATTNEKMGFVGREEGIVAYATVLLESV